MERLQNNARIHRLTNTAGMIVDLCAVGASVHGVYVRRGEDYYENITLTPPNIESRFTDTSYSGATIGPVAGRIRGGTLPIGNDLLQLALNENGNTLHGGPNNIARMLWETREKSDGSVTFHCMLPDRLDGFPGNRSIQVRYSLDSSNRLTIHYLASTDKSTFINLTNHTYWNLSGDFSKDVYDHVMQINSDRVLMNDNAHLPNGWMDVKNSVFDFNRPTQIRKKMQHKIGLEQLSIANGYNHAFCARQSTSHVVTMWHYNAHRRLTVCTDYPAFVIYTGGYLPVPGSAIAIEPQFFPETFSPILTPDENYDRWISFHFEED